MRLTHKLSLVAVAILLANCTLPSDDGVQSNEAAATTSDSFDSRDGLTAIRDGAQKERVTRSDAVGAAIAYLTDTAESAGVNSPEFKLLNNTDRDPQDGLTHVRLQQTFQGVLVWGADSVVHMDSAQVRGATGAVATKLAGMNMNATLSPSSILAKAKEERFGSRPVVTERESAEKVVHIGDDGTPRIAIHTKFFNELQGDVEPGFWNHIYDANTGELLARWNEVMTETVQASGPGGNPKWVHSWNHELDAETQAGGTVVFNTSRLRTVNMNQGASAMAEVTGSVDNIGDAPINDAHGFAEITLNFLKDWMNRDSIDDHGFKILSRVHYQRNYENAFWDGTQMTYGDGASRFYPLSGGLDVCAHEIDHGFTSKHSNLTYSGQSGGNNESFSDIAGKTAEWYYKPTPNWDLGGDVFKQPNAALRYMCDPTKDGKSIDKVSDFHNQDVHYTSGVMNKSFCLSSKRISNNGDATVEATKDGVKRAAQAYFLANASYWTSGTNYVQACQGVLDAARAMHYTDSEVNSLKQSWADVGAMCN
jgi:pseudolysin/vibriolysin